MPRTTEIGKVMRPPLEADATPIGRDWVEYAKALEVDLRRMVYVAEHLFQMVPREIWRDQGGDDSQGHYEGDYHAENVETEIREMKARVGA